MIKSKILIFFGVICMLASLGLFGFNFYEDYEANKYVNHILDTLHFDEYDTTYQMVPNKEMNVSFVDDMGYIGVLKFKEFDLVLPINYQCNDDNLKKSPCCLEGSVYTNDIIIAGHNYSSHFGKIGLLQIGSEFSFVDMNQNEFHYQVIDLFKISGSDYQALKEGDWDLTLFTCTLSRSERIVIRAINI